MNTSHVVKAAGTYSADDDVALDNPEGKAIRLTIDITDEDKGGGAGAVTVTIQAVDPASGKKTTLLASASLASVATTVLAVGPGLTAAANSVANAFVPRRLNINVNHTNANPMDYSIGAELIG